MTGFAIPDKFGVETGWRAWYLTADHRLKSTHYRAVWTPGAAVAATCQSKTEEKHRWIGMPAEDAFDRDLPLAADWEASVHDNESPRTPRPPRVVLPVGWTYAWAQPTKPPHTAPHPSCTCGIYAADDITGCQGYGRYVVGRVHLWGTVIPGERGMRAENAYPAELFVLATPLPDTSFAAMFALWQLDTEVAPTNEAVEALADYGVPVHRVKNIAAVRKVAA